MVRRSTGFLALLALLSGGCDKDIKPVPEAGYVSVSVLKETVQADGSSTFVDQGGALDLTYFTASGSKRSQGATFTGLLDVPAKVIVGGKKTYTLGAIEVLGSHDSLAKIEGDALQPLLTQAPQGVLVRVIVPADGGDASTQIVYSTQPGGELPVLSYHPLSSTFPDPHVLLTATDLAGARTKLRAAASATSNWHEDLLAVARDAQTLDLDHLQLLLSGCYYSFADRERMFTEYNQLLASPTANEAATQQRLGRLAAALRLADDLGVYVNRLVDLALPKTANATLADTLTLLENLYPSGAAGQAFREPLRRWNSQLTDALLQKLVTLSLNKNQADAGSELAAKWYASFSDHTTAKLIALAQRFHGEFRENLILASILQINDLTADKGKALVEISASRAGEVALALTRRLTTPTGAAVATLADGIADPAPRDTYLLAAVALVQAFSPDEARAVIREASDRASDVAAAVLRKVTGLNGTSLTQIASALATPALKDQALQDGLLNIPTLSLADAKIVVAASGPKVVQLAVISASKVQGLNGAGLAEIAGSTPPGPARDSILISGSATIDGLTSAGVVAMLQIAFAQRVDIARAVLPKVKDLTGLTLADIARVAPTGSERDDILIAGSNLLSRVSVAGIKAVITCADAQKATLALALIPKADSTVDGLVLADIATTAQDGGVRDAILEGAIPRLSQISMAEAKGLVGAASARKNAVAKLCLRRIPQLTATKTLDLAGSAPVGSVRDGILVDGIQLLTSLTSTELTSLLHAQTAAEQDVALQGIEKVSDLTVTNAVSVVDQISQPVKDAFLNRAVDLVTDLSANNLLTLADRSATPDGRDNVIRKGLLRLGSGNPVHAAL